MTDSDMEAISRAVRERLGIIATPEQLPALRRFAEARLSALGCAAEEYASRLAKPKELQALAASLTVPETSFFRFSALWEALKAKVLPGMIERALVQRRKLRVWSAACCTGEEPYTLAMLAAELGSAEDVDILATDVNEAYLEQAAAGKYPARALRHVPSALSEKYFKRKGAAYALDDSIRRRVRFAPLNLAEPVYPSAANGTSGLDLILCQNVLIYFEPAKSREAVRRLRDGLLEDGLLALGPSEMAPEGAGLSARQVLGAFFYAKAKAAPEAAKPKTAAKTAAPKAKAAPAADDALARAEALAGQGKLDLARALCEEWTEAHPLDAAAHYLLGLIDHDRPVAAEAHFRRVLYLDPGFLLARLHLARCAERLGRAAEAAREYATLGRLAAQRPAGELLDEKEGLTCGLLAALCRGKSKENPNAMDHRH